MQKYREYTVHYKQRRYSLFIASTTVAELLNDLISRKTAANIENVYRICRLLGGLSL